MVFRPSDSPAIRPSRMPRMAIDLKDSGELTTYAPGPDDRRVEGPGRWRLDGEHLVLEPKEGPVQRYVVDDASEDRLVLRPADEIQHEGRRGNMAERRRSGRSGSGGGGKDDGPPKTRSCGTMVVHERLLRSDPSYQAARNDSENRAFTYARRPDFLVGRSGVTVIPVVVHVVYNGAAQNISDAQIQSQIDVLNHDFRKTNADVSNLPAVFQPLAADARIEFELATTDPSSNPTNGITRTSTSATGFTDDNKVKKASSGGADAWPRDNYLNLWCCRLSGGLLGYAQFPRGPADPGGGVIPATAFANTGTAAAPFNLGRTATHEIGHWLNLRHIWGDDGSGCSGSDFPHGTPNPRGSNPATP